jgi:hypothetical protein
LVEPQDANGNRDAFGKPASKYNNILDLGAIDTGALQSFADHLSHHRNAVCRVERTRTALAMAVRQWETMATSRMRAIPQVYLDRPVQLVFPHR